MGQKSIILAIGLIIFTVILAIILVVSRARSGAKETPKKDNTPIVQQTDNTVEVIDVITDPVVYDGLNIEIEGNVADWVTKKSFTVAAGGTQGGIFGSRNSNRSLLMIRSKDFALQKDTKGNTIGLGELEKVHVKGKARIVDAKELSELLGVNYNAEQNRIDDDNLELDDNSISKWVRGTVIIVDSAEVVSNL